MLHEEINSEFEQSESNVRGGPTIRAALRGKSFDVQWKEGLRIMRKVGLLE
jgi:hypothetical protein